MDNLAFPCAACLAVGFLGGFAFGFKVVAMIKLGVQHVVPAPADQVPEVAP